MGKKFSDLERASSLNNGDLFAVAQVDAQAQTGYKSKSTETSAVAQKLLKGIEFSTDLDTDDKTVLGAINEVNSRTIAYDVVSGPIANFKTSLELPIKLLGIDVNAVQESGTPTPAAPLPISGRSEISLVHCGVNLWDEDWEVGIWNSSGQKNDSQNAIRCTNYIKIKPSETYYVFANFTRYATGIILRLLDANKSIVRTVVVNSSSTKTFTADSNVEYVVWCSSSTDQITTYSNDVSINYPSSDTAYHTYNGNTEVINLGGTYYGGHFTQDKAGHRQFEVTHSELLDMGDIEWSNFDASIGIFRATQLPNCKAPVSTADRKTGFMCTDYPASANVSINENMTDKSLLRYNGWLILRDTSFSSYTEVAEGVRGAKLFYELATPYVIDLPDGEPIITLNGINNIYADSGDASAEYALTIEEYIDKKIASVQALILNS